MKIRKLLLSLLFIGLIFFGSVTPGFSLDSKNNNSVQIEKTDSSEVEKSGEKKLTTTPARKEPQRSESSSKISYNIIYYLIAKFIMINPFTRPS